MKKRIMLMVTLFLFVLTVYPQKYKQIGPERALKIGADLPEPLTFPAIHYKDPQIDLHAWKDKVVILDFFDTYCSNCIAAMPKLKKLQQQLGDKLVIVMVSWQNKETLAKFYANNSLLKENEISFPTVYADTLLRALFPYQTVPHTAWLYKGTLQAMTFSDFVKAEHIETLWRNGKIDLPLKYDFVAENNTDQATDKEHLLGTVCIQAYKNGLPTRGLSIENDSLSGLWKTSIHNMGILNVYKAVWSKIKKPSFMLKEERIAWKVRDPTRYRYPNDGSGSNVWLAAHGICYERKDRLKRPVAEQAQLVLHDLNSFFGLRVYWDKKEISCLVLQRNDNEIKAGTDGQIEGTGVLAFMIDYSEKFPPVVDEVKSLDLRLHIEDYSSLQRLNEQLAAYGLCLVEDRRLLEVLVFEELL